MRVEKNAGPAVHARRRRRTRHAAPAVPLAAARPHSTLEGVDYYTRVSDGVSVDLGSSDAASRNEAAKAAEKAAREAASCTLHSALTVTARTRRRLRRSRARNGAAAALAPSPQPCIEHGSPAHAGCKRRGDPVLKLRRSCRQSELVLLADRRGGEGRRSLARPARTHRGDAQASEVHGFRPPWGFAPAVGIGYVGNLARGRREWIAGRCGKRGDGFIMADHAAGNQMPPTSLTRCRCSATRGAYGRSPRACVAVLLDVQMKHWRNSASAKRQNRGGCCVVGPAGTRCTACASKRRRARAARHGATALDATARSVAPRWLWWVTQLRRTTFFGSSRGRRAAKTAP